MTTEETRHDMPAEPGRERSWPVILGQAIGAQAQVEASDPDGLLAGTVPRPAATEHEVAAYEREAGEPLANAYRAFLLHANGWPGVYFTLDAFGLEELRGGGNAPHARELLETYDAEEVLVESALDAADLLPVATGQGSDLVVVIREGRPGAGTVVWFDGEEYGRYENFREFFGELVGMLEQYVNEQSAQ
jgi:hypothetical protein